MHLTRKTLPLLSVTLACAAASIFMMRLRQGRAESVALHPHTEREADRSVEVDELRTPLPVDGRAPTTVVGARSGCYAAPSGSCLRFFLEVHQDSSLLLAGDQPESTGLSMSAKGDLVLTVLARREDELLASVAYEDLHVDWIAGGEAADEAVQARTEQELAQTVYVRLRDDGTAVGWSFPDGMSPASRMMERTFLSLVRFVVPHEAGDEWATRETDSSGDYVVEYRRVGDDAHRPDVVRKRKDLVPAGSTQEIAAAATVHDDAHATFDLELGWLVAADCAERVRVESPGAEFVVEVDSHARLSLRDARREFVAAQESLWNLSWCDVMGKADLRRDAEEQEARQADAAIAGLRLENVLYQVEQTILTAGLDSRELFEARELLKTFLRRRPAELERFEQLVSDGSLGEDAMGVALSALGAIDSPAGQSFLALVAADPARSDQTRTLAMLALFQVPTPQADTTRAIAAQWADSSASERVRSTALLLLGTHARTDPERCRELLAQEARAEADGMLDTYLAALGNAHMFTDVERFLLNDDADVRATAEQVLTWR